MERRRSGILLHVSSLPSPYGIGDMGPEAYAFADFLAASKQRYWQILPLNPTDLASDNSPYHSFSAFAFNALLISPDRLIEDGVLDRKDVETLPIFPRKAVDFRNTISFKTKILFAAYERFRKMVNKQRYEKFCEDNASWLDDYALFVALKSRFRGEPWYKWPPEIRDRQQAALYDARRELDRDIQREKFLQYVFHDQWTRLKTYCLRRRIRIIGDIPIYVVHDSADVWADPEMFKLDADKKPSVVAGVPPDYFSKTGQLWGNPIYRWDVMRQRKYDWWIRRIAHNLKLFDWVRIDHFRGFVGYWEIPAKERTAVHGNWVKAPARDFFRNLEQRSLTSSIVAEDLGTITPDVREIMDIYSFPGMKVLLFAFGEDDPDHPYLPHTYGKNCLVYTGTHDNNTVQGWFREEADPEDKKRFYRYIGREVEDKDVHWEFIRMGAMSRANTLIIPLQDVLGLGAEARMNTPATKSGNWRWRYLSGQLTTSITENLSEMTERSGRA